ncbi:pyridoxal-dependent decarboxylase [Mycena rebaudengoi]|nr:pyridoxal-dependent decarboxylase [Mycena rebaudengoi]
MLNEFASTIATRNQEFNPTLPQAAALTHAEASLPTSMPDEGMGMERIKQHLLDDLVPAFNGPSLSSNYYGFVTGGNTDASLYADWLVSFYDQNVGEHLPKQTVASSVEKAALRLLQQLLDINESDFSGVFNTGATAGNIQGLALGREFAVAEAGRRLTPPKITSIAQRGIVSACHDAGVRKIQVLTTMPHSSLRKAASVVGLGWNSVILLPLSAEEPWRFDLGALETKLKNTEGAVSIIAVSAGEVNTGRFATTREEMIKIRALANTYGAWVHVDGAFGLQARVLLSSTEHDTIVDGVSALDLADSLAGDTHKLLNVPYDCGFFLTRHLQLLQAVFQNGVNVVEDVSPIPSAHNLGIENSRRLRALPIYASLLTHGRIWHRELLEGQIAIARAVASFIKASPVYELLPKNTDIQNVYMVVLFRARSDALNARLVPLLNASKVIYVSGTQWDGRPATRIAVSTWRVDVKRDAGRVIAELENVARENESELEHGI